MGLGVGAGEGIRGCTDCWSVSTEFGGYRDGNGGNTRASPEYVTIGSSFHALESSS